MLKTATSMHHLVPLRDSALPRIQVIRFNIAVLRIRAEKLIRASLALPTLAQWAWPPELVACMVAKTFLRENPDYAPV